LANKTERFSTWVSYTYSVNDYEFDSFTLYLPNNVDIRHSASLGFNYDILDNQEFEEFGAMANRIPAQLRVMKQSKAVIILWLIMVRQIVKT
jgi:hypothetical protein